MNSRSIDQQESKSHEPKIKKIVAQCFAVIGPAFLQLMCGMSLGFLTILIPELYKEDAEIVVTTDELTWISSVKPFIAPLGSLIAGPLVDRVGRKPMIISSAAFIFLGWFLIYVWASSAWTLMLVVALLGFSDAFTDASCRTYVSEVTEFRYRGTVLTIFSVSYSLGMFLQLLIGNYLHWRTCALVDAIITPLALMTVLFVPESPQWLAKQGRLPETKRSLRWLRGWTDSNSMKLEYDLLIQASSRDTAEQSSTSCGNTVKSLFRQEVLLPFSLVAFAFIISSFNCINSIATYSVIVFEKIESPIDEYDATIINGALQVLPLLILILFIRRTGKRLPTLGSLFISVLALLGVSVCLYLRRQNIIQQDSGYSWIPTTLVLLGIFVCSGGIQTTPWILASELLPVEVKGVSLSILGSFFSVCSAIANKSFLYILDGLTLPGAFAFYAAICFLGFVVLYRVMPETEGKSLAEIEKIYQKKSRTHDGGESAMQLKRFTIP